MRRLGEGEEAWRGDMAVMEAAEDESSGQMRIASGSRARSRVLRQRQQLR
jgi:hypothetical protein